MKTKNEAIELLKGTKVYVNGKSKQIQSKLFKLGFSWVAGNDESQLIARTEEPFIYIWTDMEITCSSNMEDFKLSRYKEIRAEDILNLEWEEDKSTDDLQGCRWHKTSEELPKSGLLFVKKVGTRYIPRACAYNKTTGKWFVNIVGGHISELTIEKLRENYTHWIKLPEIEEDAKKPAPKDEITEAAEKSWYERYPDGSELLKDAQIDGFKAGVEWARKRVIQHERLLQSIRS